MNELILYLIAAYLAVGVTFVALTKSQGVASDIIFGALWPYFVWRQIMHGY